MNKKFTMMVAALLATGGTFAQAAQNISAVKLADVESGKYYYIVGSAADDATIDDTNDFYMGVKGDSNSEMAADVIPAASAALPEGVKNDKFIWFVEVKESGSKKYITLTNKETGLKLAVNPSDNTIITDKADYNDSSITDFLVDGTNIKMGGEALNIKIDDSGTDQVIFDTDAEDGVINIIFHEAEIQNSPASVSDIVAKYGEGTSFGWEGDVEGEDLFKNVSLVTVAKNGSGAYNFTATGTTFLLQVGKATKTSYDLSQAADLEAFKKAEFIALTQTKNAEVSFPEDKYALGYGFTYAKIKGSNFLEATSKLEAGKVPAQNAIFKALENANKPGKYALAHANAICVAGAENWTQSTATPYVSVVGQTDKSLASGENISWGAFNLGDVVDVKTFVTAKMLVNVHLTAGTSTSNFDRALTMNAAGTAAEVATSAEATEAALSSVYGQWYISANEDNTITLINRETEYAVENIQLNKTEVTGVYTATSGILSGKHIKFELVKGETEFDGFLKLTDAELLNSYSLSTEYAAGFDKGTVNVIANGTALKNAEFGSKDKAFTFKFTPAKIENKLDTVEISSIDYSFYKDGKLTTETAELKAISYNLTNLENAGDNKYVKDDFDLASADGTTSGKFIFRTEGDKIVIAKAGGLAEDNFISNTTDYQFDGQFSEATRFILNTANSVVAYDVPENHFALEINNAYIGAKADNNAILTADTSLLKSTNVDSSFSFWAYSADKEETLIPSYYLSSNGKMMYYAKSEVDAIKEDISKLNPVLQADEVKALEDKLATYYYKGEEAAENFLVKFKAAKYDSAEALVVDADTVKGDDLKPYKFNVLDVDGQAVLKNANGGYVKVLNEVVLFNASAEEAAKFDLVAAEAPTSNEGVSASDVKVVAQNGSVVVKNAAGKNVVVSTILGQVVVNEVLTSDNATINVPAGIVVVVVEGESFKVNVK